MRTMYIPGTLNNARHFIQTKGQNMLGLLEKCYIYNIFTHFHILSNKLLLKIIDGLKSNFSSKFNLEPITTKHLRFVVKALKKFVDVALLFLMYCMCTVIKEHLNSSQ